MRPGLPAERAAVMDDAGDQVCWTVLFKGRVQGVGFRYRAEHLARSFDVAGYVRNLADGRVELVAEGTRSQVAGLVDAVEREMTGYIRDRDRQEQPPTGRPAGFSIRY